MISFEIFREINSLVSIEKIINRSVKSAELLGRVRDIIVNADNSEFGVSVTMMAFESIARSNYHPSSYTFATKCYYQSGIKNRYHG